MKFEFDAQKSAANQKKYGIDFKEAQKLWHDWNLLEIPARKVGEENRYLVIGTIGARYWSAVITYRGDAIRIISVRRSREEEIGYYESTGF